MDEAQWTQVVGERAAPEYMEVLFFWLLLMTVLRLGVSLMTNICTNKRRTAPDKGADQNPPSATTIPDDNPTGLERDPNGFLGETGARVIDVQHTGNLLGMLLQSTRDGSYRVLTWTFKKGCALDWFPSGPTEEDEKPTEENEKPTEETEKPTEENEKPTEETEKSTEETEKPSTHPGSYFERVRSQMAFWFCFANLLEGGREVLAQIDFSNNMNQADWNMYTVPGDFDFSKGWFDTFTGNVSILDQPSVWMERVREDFGRRVATDPDLPAVVWMGERFGATVWKGIGCLSKSEILNRFWKNTGIGVFVTLGELTKKDGSREDWLTDLCLATIMFLRSQAWAGKYYNLKSYNVKHNLKLWRRNYLVFERAGMVKCGPAPESEHDQLWADPLSIDPDQWQRMAQGSPEKWAPWTRSEVKAEDNSTPWCTKQSAGSDIERCIPSDNPAFQSHPEKAPSEPLASLEPNRMSAPEGAPDQRESAPAPENESGKLLKKSEPVRQAAKRARLDSDLEEGEIKRSRRFRPGPLDRREAKYGKAGWRENTIELIKKLDAHGIQHILGRDWEQPFKNLG